MEFVPLKELQNPPWTQHCRFEIRCLVQSAAMLGIPCSSPTKWRPLVLTFEHSASPTKSAHYFDSPWRIISRLCQGSWAPGERYKLNVYSADWAVNVFCTGLFSNLTFHVHLIYTPYIESEPSLTICVFTKVVVLFGPPYDINVDLAIGWLIRLRQRSVSFCDTRRDRYSIDLAFLADIPITDRLNPKIM